MAAQSKFLMASQSWVNKQLENLSNSLTSVFQWAGEKNHLVDLPGITSDNVSTLVITSIPEGYRVGSVINVKDTGANYVLRGVEGQEGKYIWDKLSEDDYSTVKNALSRLENKVGAVPENSTVMTEITNAKNAAISHTDTKIGTLKGATVAADIATAQTAAEKHADDKIGTLKGATVVADIATAKQEAIDAAASDATSKANTAENNANNYTNEVVGTLPEGKTVAEAISEAKTTAAADATSKADAAQAAAIKHTNDKIGVLKGATVVADIATAKQEAIDAAASDATSKANTAAKNAVNYVLLNKVGMKNLRLQDPDTQKWYDVKITIDEAGVPTMTLEEVTDNDPNPFAN